MFNAPALARRLFGRKSASLSANGQSKRDFKFKVGDFVRLSKTHQDSLEKAIKAITRRRFLSFPQDAERHEKG